MFRRLTIAIFASFALPLALAEASADDPTPPSTTPPAAAQTPTSAGAPSSHRHSSVTPVRTDPSPSSTVADAHDTTIAASACAEDMVLVEGEYCTDVRQECTRWLDDRSLPFARCAEYARTPRCAGAKVKMRYCIAAHEMAGSDGLPVNHQSFVTAAKLCKESGKRLCTESEWNFACEGEELRPYPYGFERKPVCNQDREDLFEQNPRRKVLRDLRAPSTGNLECVSPFGVYNMVGNVDETVQRTGAEHNRPYRNALKGGWWMAGRNRCRPATTAHDDYYEGIQVGVRCCADAPGSPPNPTG